MAQRTQKQSLQGPAGVSLAGESKSAKNAGKEDAKLKADPRGQTEKNREEADNKNLLFPRISSPGNW